MAAHDPADALRRRARALREAGEAGEACAVAIQAVEAAPGRAPGWQELGRCMFAAGQLEGAEAAWREALRRDPGSAPTWSNLGLALHRGRRSAEAVPCFERALQLQPASAEALTNLSLALGAVGRFEEARAAAARAVERQPDNPRLLGNLGNALRHLGRVDEALAAYDRALALQPASGSLQWNRALALLLRGDLQAGFAGYGARDRREDGPGGAAPVPGVPAWDGRGEVPGRLLLLAEQGFGDAIQFVRFAAAARAGQVAVRCHRRLGPLLSTAPGVDEVVDKDAPAPPAAAWARLMDLPGLLGVDEAALGRAVPYLRADPARVRAMGARLGPGGLRVGIGWQGNPAFEADRLRSPPLAAFGALAGLPGLRLFSLQKHHGTEQLRDPPPGLSIEDLGRELDNGEAAFLDTAAALEALDLCITSDTALAHLAGALGRPTFLVLPYAPDWRWMLDRADSPWYPSMRLFRQPAPGDWAGAFATVRAALEGMGGLPPSERA